MSLCVHVCVCVCTADWACELSKLSMRGAENNPYIDGCLCVCVCVYIYLCPALSFGCAQLRKRRHERAGKRTTATGRWKHDDEVQIGCDKLRYSCRCRCHCLSWRRRRRQPHYEFHTKCRIGILCSRGKERERVRGRERASHS